MVAQHNYKPDDLPLVLEGFHCRGFPKGAWPERKVAFGEAGGAITYWPLRGGGSGGLPPEFNAKPSGRALGSGLALG